MVLFDLLRRLSGPLDFRLACVHVNHGISPNARRWAEFCARLCKRHGVGLTLDEVDIRPYRAAGVEAAARRARYEVYARQNADCIVLAQHQDDQAETLLLQLLRGAGVKGGAAMPLVRRQVAGCASILRPLLGVPRGEIENYARARKLKWVEDESNADMGYDRNFLRLKVMPVIERAFPAYRSTLARSAGHLAEADAILDELAQADALRAARDGKLSVDAMKRLGAARSRNLLRGLLWQRGGALPEADRLEEALRQLFEARRDSAVCVALGDHELRRHDGSAYLLPRLPEPPANLRRKWDGKRIWRLPELRGALCFGRSTGAGLSAASIKQAGLSLRLRRGGEKLRIDAKRPTRSLKNLLQESRMPPWQRDRLPLLYCGAELACVPGVGIASKFQTRPGESGWFVTWDELT